MNLQTIKKIAQAKANVQKFALTKSKPYQTGLRRAITPQDKKIGKTFLFWRQTRTVLSGRSYLIHKYPDYSAKTTEIYCKIFFFCLQKLILKKTNGYIIFTNKKTSEDKKKQYLHMNFY